jgi:type IV pilus assembly protein PilC
MGWDMFVLKLPVMGNLIEKNIMARTTRTLGTLVTSGVPILEGLNITRETAGNALFERLYGKVTESIREGNTVAKPMKDYSKLGFHPACAFFWFALGALPGCAIMMLTPMEGMGGMLKIGGMTAGVCGMLSTLFYLTKINNRVVDDLVVNMVDVGEETGELDTMLYKVADTYDEEVKTLTDGLMALLEPLMICFLGGAVGFIVVSLFMPLVSLIQGLS